MKSKDFVAEGFVEDANDVHLDHEVQMAREECYHAAEHALALHKLLRNVSEQQGLEGWVSAKITLANEYLNTVREHLEYELLQGQVDDMDQMAIGLPIAEGREIPVTEGALKQQMHNDAESMSLEDFMEKYAVRPEDERWVKEFWQNVNGEEDLAEMDSQGYRGHRGDEDPGKGPEKVVKPAKTKDVKKDAERTLTKALDQAHKKKGVAEGATCNKTMEGESCPVHGLKECPSYRARALAEWKRSQRRLKETTAGSVAGVVNPGGKPKSKVGSLFGGTYKQPTKKKA